MKPKPRPQSAGPRPYRIVMVDEESGETHKWTSGFKTRESAQREADRLNARRSEYRMGYRAEVLDG